MIKSKIEFEYFIKGKLAENGLNISKLAEMLGTSHANLSKKIKIASLNYIDLNQIADLLGYDIIWEKRK